MVAISGTVETGTKPLHRCVQGISNQGGAKKLATAKEHALKKVVPLSNVSDDGVFEEPYSVAVKLKGASDLLFHRWSNEDVQIKAASAKGSKQKREDNIESYLYRDSHGIIGIPGEYLRQSVIHAAKFRQDPRSPRKSAMDLVKAGVVSLTDLASLGVKEPDYLDRRRVTIQRAGITRVRPAVRQGWGAEFVLQVLLPEYISTDFLHDLVTQAGRLIGFGDFRPTYGRFYVVNFEMVKG